MNPSIEFRDVEPIEIEVKDLNYIPAYKIAEQERRENELQRIASENQREINEIDRKTKETERKTYYEDFKSKVDSGYFIGDSGVHIGSEPPTDEDVNVWIDPNGTPEVAAENIVFADNESLQTKYENGELKGEKGDKGADGTMTFSDLTEEQKASLKGDKGDKGDTGERGEKGTDGYTPVKGADYFTPEDIASLNIPTNTSELNNDSNFVNNSDLQGLKGKILWTNPNTSIAFDSKVVTLSSADYDCYEIIYFVNSVGYNRILNTGKIIKGYSTYLIGVLEDTAKPLVSRVVWNPSDTTIDFGNAYSGSSTTSGSENKDNTLAIPLHVIGYKTGLFS